MPRHRALTALFLALSVAIPGYHFFDFISRYSVNVLFFDQWDYMAPLFEGDTSLARLFLYQHGPHREGIGLVADSLLYPLTNWNSRAESFLIGACFFVSALLALRLSYKLSGKLSPGDAAIPLMFLSVSGFETFVTTPNAAYSGFPLLLIMLYCLALLQPRWMIRYSLCLGLNFLLIYTGFGIFMGVVTIGLFALECLWAYRGAVPFAAALAALLTAVASMASFFIHYRFDPAVACFEFPYHDFLAYPRFVALMIARFFTWQYPVRLSLLLGLIGMLAALAVFAVVARTLVTRRRPEGPQLVVGALLAYSTLFVINTAIGRVCLGLPESAWPSRYVPLLIPGVLAAYLQLQSFRTWKFRRVLTSVFVLLLIPGCLFEDQTAAFFTEGKRAWAKCYLATRNISGCDQATGFPIYPDPYRTGLLQKLDYLRAHNLSFFAD